MIYNAKFKRIQAQAQAANMQIAAKRMDAQFDVSTTRSHNRLHNDWSARHLNLC